MAKASKQKKAPAKKIASIDVNTFLKSAKAIARPLSRVDDFAEALELKGPLLLLGNEELRIKRLISWLAESILPKDTNIVRHWGGQITSKAKVQDLKADLASDSLFSTNQCHIILNIDQIKAAQFSELEPALQQSFVILTGKLEQKKGSAVEKLSKFSAVKLEPLTGNNLVRWIAKEVSDLGVSGIDTNAAQLLARSFEGELDHLQTELAKLSLLTNKESTISLEMVQEHTQISIEKSSFDLLEAISKKDVASTLFLTHKLQAQGSHPLQLCAFLAKCYRVMAANQQTLSGGPTSSSAELGNKWFISKLQSTMRRIGSTDVFRSLLILKNLDEELKGSSLVEQSVVDLAMQKLALRS